MVHTFGTSDTFIIIYMISAAAICTALNPYRAMLTYAFTRAAAHTQLILGELTLHLLFCRIDSLCSVYMEIKYRNLEQ